MKDKFYRATEALLYNYNMLKVSIENMKLEIEEIEKEDGTTGISYDGISASRTYKFTSQTENTAVRNIEYKDILKKRIEITENKLIRIDNAIKALSDTERKVIELKYIQGKEWWQVAAEVYCSERWCRELRKRAISKMAIGIYGYTSDIVPPKQ